LLVYSERNTIATEQIATAVQTYTNHLVTQKPLKLASPYSFTGALDKVEGFLNALTLYFDRQQITDSAQRIIFGLSLVKVIGQRRYWQYCE
ncbi:hypothetical protein B0H17DRAFT_1290062, partial [Mycena rosella]